MIRQADANDIAALSNLAIQTYTEAFGASFSGADLAAHVETHLSPGLFAQRVEEDVVLIADEGSRLVGYLQFGAVEPESAAPADQELRRLYVRREFQNAGRGGALMEAALSHPHMRNAPRIFLEVWEHNFGAQRFYRRFGFEVIGTRPFVTASGVAASRELVMVRRSPPVRDLPTPPA